MSFNAYSKKTKNKLEIILAEHIKQIRRSMPWSGENTHIVKKIALTDMKKDNVMFDDLDGYFGNPTDELDKLVEDFLK